MKVAYFHLFHLKKLESHFTPTSFCAMPGSGLGMLTYSNFDV
jgi:hypothetical protein